MEIVKEFTTQFEIEFVTELRNALFDMLRLYADVFLVVKRGHKMSQEQGGRIQDYLLSSLSRC